ncbi:PD-(D/E)XK nuclease family protein [Campylobacter sp. CCS1377]|uniref:PD-(D/E)XK nuclease family protein n=1 Tax=Campylobacter sp. CCS1377 TaxID=3158229 RepID=A0AAU7E8E9_9BACT
MKLNIFSSTRQIKEYYRQNKNANSLLDPVLHISDFLDRVCLLNTHKASSYETLLLMQEACKKSKDLESKLGISTEFFAFLKNNEYLFSFFKELALEKRSICDLKNNDYYAAYNEHLDILEEVFQNYLSLLDRANLHDELSLVKNYSLNLDFLDEYESIKYDLQGFLSRFEEELFVQISQYKDFILCFRTSAFNLEYLSNLDFLRKLSLNENCYYEFNIKTHTIVKQEKIPQTKISVKLRAFEIRTLQVSFVMDEISNFIRAGLKPENIVVITPDECFCNTLRLWDKNNVLNFASGISIKESFFYQKLKALYDSANLESFEFNESLDYFENKESVFDYHNTLLHYFKLDFNTFKARFNEKCEVDFFEDLVKVFLLNEKKELIVLIEKELYFIKDLLKNQTLTLKELLELFFIQISSLTLSDIGGGKVTVMGLLESRGLSFDGVIMVDFNDDIIPKRSINELFLNNDIRKQAGLISYERRENLQRFYYESLMTRAKKVSISYVENEQSCKSRFLDELDFEFEEDNKISPQAYLDALKLDYEEKKPNLEPLKAPILRHNIFATPLSFSRLNLFLKQKRTYYYRYILNLLEPRALEEQKSAKNLGIFIHKILELYYQQNKNFFDEDEFMFLLHKQAKIAKISELDVEILKLKFARFAKVENERFSQGYRVEKTEFEIKPPKKYKLKNGFSVDLIGTIDRIDNLNNDRLILDYKSGKIEDNSYQLAFYKLLIGKNCAAKFYDLNDFKIKNGKNTKDVLELEELLEELVLQSKEEIEFENTKDEYCPYKLLYKKELK